MGAPIEEEAEQREAVASAPVEPITAQQFAAWKAQKDAQAATVSAELARKRLEDITTGRLPMNGRELFQHEPWVFDDSRFADT